METFKDFLLLVFGWGLGTVSPLIERFFVRRRRRNELLAGLAYECNELRFTLANALVTSNASLGTLDQPTLALLRPIFLEYSDVLNREATQITKQVFSKPDQELIRGLIAANAKRDAFGRPLGKYPMPYSLPLLDSHIGELDLLPLFQQRTLLRIEAELRLFNEQVSYTRELNARTYTLTGENHVLNASNLAGAEKNLGTRTELLIKAINRFIEKDGAIREPDN